MLVDAAEAVTPPSCTEATAAAAAARHRAPRPRRPVLPQQTLVPLQKLGPLLGFGVLGSLLLGFGVVFLAMSGLRALQDETGDTFTGDWSWVRT